MLWLCSMARADLLLSNIGRKNTTLWAGIVTTTLRRQENFMDVLTVVRDYLCAAFSGVLLVSLLIRIQQCKPLHRACAVMGIMTTAFMVSVTFLQWGHRGSFVGNVACFITIVEIGILFKIVLSSTDDQRARIMALFTPTTTWALVIGAVVAGVGGYFMARHH